MVIYAEFASASLAMSSFDEVSSSEIKVLMILVNYPLTLANDLTVS